MSDAEYLVPGRFVDSDAPAVATFARDTTAGIAGDTERILRLFYAIRDGILYDPYVDMSDPVNYRASSVLALGRGFCVGKAALLAASARVLGVPARVGYADVRNHMTSPKLMEQLKTDVFIWHSYTEVKLGGRWVKATPAFNLSLCDRLGLKPLDFDGRTDSLFHEFDKGGQRHMEYIRDRGPFADVPFSTIVSEFEAYYPGFTARHGLSGDFQTEAVAAG